MNQRLKIKFKLCAVLAALIAGNACSKPQEKAIQPALNVSSIKLATIPVDHQPVIPSGHQPGECVFSPDGRHVAYPARKDGKSFVVLDGKADKPYDHVEALVFSPDSQQTAYSAKTGDKNVRVVVNGHEETTYEDVGVPGFSPDGRIVYEAKKGGKWLMVVGKRESPPFDMSYAPPIFSPDGKLIVYIEQDYTRKKNTLVVCSSEMTGRIKGPEYDSLTLLTSSRDRSRFAYCAKKGEKWVVVTRLFAGKGVTEKEGAAYDDVGGLALSDDGNHVAYFAQRNGQPFLVVDGVEKPCPPGVLRVQPVFSRDGSKVAGMALMGGPTALMVDGKVGRQYVDAGLPVFSPDGSRIAYPASKGNSGTIVVNGKEGPAYDTVVIPQFSPDGSWLVYRAKKKGQRFVVTADRDGRILREQPFYEMVWEPVFSPDGKSIAYGVRSGQELWWKVEPLK